MGLEGGAHRTGVFCPAPSFSPDMLDLVTSHPLRKVSCRLEHFHDLFVASSDIQQESC